MTSVPGTRAWTVSQPPPDGFRLDFDGLTPANPALAARLLYNRGVRTREAARRYLNGSFDDLADPMRLPGMELATRRIMAAIRAGDPIGVFGDFDVDGLTGTAIVISAIRILGGKALPYIPHREQDGHGLSLRAIESFRAAGVKLIITVDTGTTATAEIAAARAAGIDTVITDHHLPDGELPDAVALVNPNLPGDDESTNLAGAGVAFKLAQSLCLAAGRELPSAFLALAALGTIADAAPLTGENRVLVRSGLEELGRTTHAGLQALLARSRSRGSFGRPDTELVAFQIAPRLNAPGRLGDAEPSLQILTTDDPVEAEILAARLDSANDERRRLSELLWKEVERQLRDRGTDSSVLSVSCSGYPAGLLGPLAGRLCERYGKPAIAYVEVDGFARASVRSTPGFDIHGALAPLGGQLVRFGGHARAAGFTVAMGYLDAVLGEVERTAAWANLRGPETPPLKADAEATLDGLGASMWDFVRRMEPFGEANPQPLFIARSLSPVSVKTVGAQGKHLRLTLEQGGKRVDAIGFGLGSTSLGDGRVDAAFELRSDSWNGRIRYELGLRDVQPARR